MITCPFCNNKINEKDNFCNYCGSCIRTINNNSNKKSDIKVFIILAVIFTIAYLGFYFVNCCIWGWFSELGKGLSVGETYISPLREFAGISAISMTMSFFPWLGATIFSFLSKKKLLIIFNLLIMLINIFFVLFESFL